VTDRPTSPGPACPKVKKKQLSASKSFQFFLPWSKPQCSLPGNMELTSVARLGGKNWFGKVVEIWAVLGSVQQFSNI